jgi:hypothetical protein
MQKSKTAILVVLVLLLLVSQASLAGRFDDLYTRVDLEAARDRYGPNLKYVWEHDLKGRLTAAQQRMARHVTMDLPLIGANGHPFDFYADPRIGRITIPILSVKFLDEIAIAYAHMDRHGCNALLLGDYVGLLAHRKVAQLHPKRLLPPFEALPIPENALEDAFVDDVSGKTLKSALYFLMAHELAHVILRHRRYSDLTAAEAQTQEIEADSFALDLMRRISVAPLGMAFFFVMASRIEPVPADFETAAAFEAYLRQKATHPLTSARLNAIAQYLRTHVDAFTRGQTLPTLWRPKILQVATEIGQIGTTLEDRAIRDLQRRRSLTVTYADLADACP